VLGVSGRAMLEALIAGQTDPAAMAALAKSRDFWGVVYETVVGGEVERVQGIIGIGSRA